MRSPLGRLAAACRLFLIVPTVLIGAAQSAPAATLAGRVSDPDGRMVAGVHVIVATSIGTAAETATDRRGEFQIDGLAAGRYDIRVLAEGFQADPLTVEIGAVERRDVQVQLRLSALAESIVVSAAQIDLPLSRAAASVTVVTASDLQARQIESVTDALRLVPGLGVTRSGGRGAITSLFPRGGSSNYTLVLVDGMRVNEFGGGSDFARLPVSDIDRIEIVRGPQSALFGADAIGAVVQIVTRRGGPPRVDGLVEGGGFGTERAAVDAAGSRGRWTWGGGAEQTRSSGYAGVAPATGERVSNDDDHLAHVSGTLGWERQNGPDFLVSGNLTRTERGFPGPFGSDPIGAFPGVDRISRGVSNTRQIGSRIAFPWSARVRQRLEANYTDLASEFASPYGPYSSGTRRFGGRIQEDVAFSPVVGASVGLELLRERGSSTYVTGATGKPIPIHRGVAGSFGEIRYVGGERLFATAGVRVEHITRDALEASADVYSPRPAFPGQTVNSVNPKIAVSYLVTRPGSSRTSTRLRASAGTGIRPPDAFEIAFTDNPNLKPERSRSIDGGVEQQFAGGAYALTATAFFNRYDDLIVTVGRVLADASRYRTDNISNARARGLELSGDARLGAAVTLHVAYTFLDSGILSVNGLGVAPPPFAVGDALLRRPHHQGTIDATYAVGRVTAFGQFTSRSRTLDVEPNYGASGGLFFSPGYGVVNAGASVRLARGLEVYARVLNLLDHVHEETLGYPALGRSGIVGCRVAARR